MCREHRGKRQLRKSDQIFVWIIQRRYAVRLRRNGQAIKVA